MAKKITISQQTSAVWQTITLISSLDVVLFLILSLTIHDPLWSGIFRLIAFIGFACGVIGFLQMRGKTDTMILQIDHGQLTVIYVLRAKKTQKELFELNNVKKIKTKPAPPVFKIIPRKDIVLLQISFTDTDNTLSLLRFEGRDLFVCPSEANRVQAFLKKHIHHKVDG